MMTIFKPFEFDALTGIDPDDYDDDDEYLEAVSSFAWRKKYEYDAETGIDAMDYDDEDEYLEELKEATDYL